MVNTRLSAGTALRKRRRVADVTVGKVLILLFLLLCTALALYPILYILSLSLSGAKHLLLQDVYVFPKEWTLASYRLLFSTKDIWVAYKNTVLYTLGGTVIGVGTTIPLSFAVSQRDFAGRRIVIWLVMITMFFSGGTVANYILISNLHLMDTVWAIILPGAVNAWNMIVARTYFLSIPSSLFESAQIDGAGAFKRLWYFAIPLAKPIIAVLTMYMIVGFWNTYFTSMLYLQNTALQPIQNYLDRLLNNADFGATDITGTATLQIEQLKYSAIVVTLFPIMMIYPFFQKYFVNGIMVGSIKG